MNGLALLSKLAVALALLLVGAAAGCTHAPPGKLEDDPAILRLKNSAAPRIEGVVALAPVETRYKLRRTEAEFDADPGRCPLLVDRAALEGEIASALIKLSPIRSIDSLEPRGGTDTAVADYLRDAYARGDETLLQLTLRDVRGEYRGRNALFWPNLVLWYALWVPSFFVRDEDYAAVIDAEATFYDVVAERPIMSVPLYAEEERSLDDFDRGWDIIGLFRLPDNLDAASWARVRETLLPHAIYKLERDLVARAYDFSPQSASRAASVVGLVVDVGRYEKEPAVTSSPSCAADGKLFLDALSRQGRVPAKNVERLSGTAALRHKVENDLRNRVAQRARAEDTIVIYFAGAGTTGPDGQPYLLPYDADPAQPLERCAISFGRLGELLAPSRARRLVLVLDASFSNDRALGRSVRMGAAGANGGAAPAARLDDLAKALPGWSVAILAAGAPDEGAMDLPGSGQGLFTLYLARAMQGKIVDKDADGRTSAEELHAAFADKVALQASVDGRTQRPLLHRWPQVKPGAKLAHAASWLPTLDYPAPPLADAPKPATGTAAPASSSLK